VSYLRPAARSGGSHRRPNTVRTSPARPGRTDVPQETAALLGRQRGIDFDAEVVEALFRVRDAGLLELAGI
jgi:hypothetical protein